jgi:release factor glutamine methyltransferase
MNAELHIMFTLDCDRAYLYAHPERELTSNEIQRYDEALARRSTGVPAQYITGHQEFWGGSDSSSGDGARGGGGGGASVAG